MSSSPDGWCQTTLLHGGNAAFLEALYERYLADPAAVDPSWRRHFDQLREGAAAPEITNGPIRDQLQRFASAGPVQPNGCLDPIAAQKQAAVLSMINAYRYRGHQVADLDPLRLHEPPTIPDLDLAYHQLGPEDLDQVFHTGSLAAPARLSLREILRLLRETYCGTVGAEYMHITDTQEKRWIQRRLEAYRARPELDAEGRRWLLRLLTAAEGLETYLHRRYVGQKRFSLEGGEALIPLLDELIQRASRQGTQEVVIGMAHRGRLNVLVNILGKPPAAIFDEFEERVQLDGRRMLGDVKYHLGFATDIETPSGLVHIALGFNPSHLEIIDPVIQGSVRARQQRRHDQTGDQVLPVLIHGDAAFAGQGVVMETLQLSQTRGYGTGGTVHIIVNNQIGFTTSHPRDIRSTPYCTDVAKMVQAPVFHVNGDDPEAVIFVTRLALDFRNQFHKDVLIDLVCYRRHGHNEADEPAVTQPLMYQRIRRHPTPRTLYAQRLIAQGLIAPEAVQAMAAEYQHALEQGVVVARPVLCALDQRFRVDWRFCCNQPWDHRVATGVPIATLHRLTEAMLCLPEGFSLHPRVERLWEERRRMGLDEQPVDWGYAEMVAYASLLDAGIPVRLSGQDVGRGTFFHRHAKVYDQVTGKEYVPLQHLGPHQGAFIAINSILSEEAVLAYEYGFASAEPNALTLWEAQFGDFVNNAQVVIDQFISSAYAKWGLYCGLVLLLPHGLEGQGAEHSSARLERFLQLCANDNMQVCIPSTPAQIFHLLRRQMLRPHRTPLIVLTPKSLLRHRLAVSPLAELAQGEYRLIIPEIDPLDPQEIQRIILCSGKVYYDLLEARRARGQTDVALLRIEQLYPFPKRALAAALAPYAHVQELIWCQEEPQNQGAWNQIKHRFHHLIQQGKRLYYVGRPVSAAPAVGHRALHLEQQARLVDEALNGRYDPKLNARIALL
ncbi:2-oxoglutarate dehydrogenase E1 component [Caldichromatium japonicum]|uniref:2-oxoglutarate dehydrogenase E1 component n=1 Tax=Caldichromatium japonicum TaxID=2699430 RepID=A0A6G7VB94_9GAMM|nr:2-oxoglutarate dehydrogenase E1 component [Caldichromatium japonicum]QIK37244.1 2-oxoglutarate dehydrogenase E1 component [Caldichromatium japonicum]